MDGRRRRAHGDDGGLSRFGGTLGEEQMTKRMFLVLSEWGDWELIGPLEACDAAGHEIMVEVLERGWRRYGW
jgi:hypothetical protein